MTNSTFHKKLFLQLESDLLSKFGRDRLEQTAFPAYFNKLSIASNLAWGRVFTARELLSETIGSVVLDFGSGLGVALPYLMDKYSQIVACDTDIEVTKYVAEKLGLEPIDFVKDIHEWNRPSFDTILALDVLEHVDDLSSVLQSLMAVTADNGTWIVSGPTENLLYRLARKIAGTSGEGHLRNVYTVFDAIQSDMKLERIRRLPYGIPLFLVGRFRNTGKEIT